MQEYRRAWLVWWGLFALSGTAAALVVWPGPAVALVWILGGTVGAFFGIGVSNAAVAENPFADIDIRAVRRGAGIGGFVASGAAGWGQISIGGTVALVVIAAVTSPPVVRMSARLVGTGPRQVPAPQDRESIDAVIARAGSVEEACRSFTTLELCLAWQHSFTITGATPEPDRAMRLLVVRQAFLDELARRDPVGLEAWMSSPTPVHVAPTAYFAAGPDTQAA
jgi:hypothetical protein